MNIIIRKTIKEQLFIKILRLLTWLLYQTRIRQILSEFSRIGVDPSLAIYYFIYLGSSTVPQYINFDNFNWFIKH